MHEIHSDPFSFVIRRATLADAAVARDLTVRNFTETFGHLYPPQDLSDFLGNTYSLDAHRRVLADADHALWLLEHDGDAIGHALAGPCGLPHPQVVSGDRELKRLYVLARAHNHGLGARLFETVLAWMLHDGPRPLWIGVWSQNLGAQRFYARYGFAKVGEYEFPVGKTRDHEFILRREASFSPRGKEARSRIIDTNADERPGDARNGARSGVASFDRVRTGQGAG